MEQSDKTSGQSQLKQRTKYHDECTRQMKQVFSLLHKMVQKTLLYANDLGWTRKA